MSSKIDGVNYYSDPLPAPFAASPGSLVSVLTNTNGIPNVFILSIGTSVLCCHKGATFLRKYDLDSKDAIEQYLAGILKRHTTEDPSLTVEHFIYTPAHHALGMSLLEAYQDCDSKGEKRSRKPNSAAAHRLGDPGIYTIENGQPKSAQTDDLMSLLGIAGAADFTTASGPATEHPGRGGIEHPTGKSAPPHRSLSLPLRKPEEYLATLRRK